MRACTGASWSEQRRHTATCVQYRPRCRVQSAERIQADKLHLSLTFYPPTRRAFDLDNALARMKSGLDGLADVLEVDDRHWSLSIARADEVGGMVKVEVRHV